MATKTITIDVQTKANLAALNKLIGGLGGVGKSLKDFSSSMGGLGKSMTKLASTVDKVEATQRKMLTTMNKTIAAANKNAAAVTKVGTAANKTSAAIANYGRQSTTASRALDSGTLTAIRQFGRLDDLIDDSTRAAKEFVNANKQLNNVAMTGNMSMTQRKQIMDQMRSAYATTERTQRNLLQLDRQRVVAQAQLAQASRKVAEEQARVKRDIDDTLAQTADPRKTAQEQDALSRRFDNLTETYEKLRKEQNQLAWSSKEFDKITDTLTTTMTANEKVLERSKRGMTSTSLAYDRFRQQAKDAAAATKQFNAELSSQAKAFGRQNLGRVFESSTRSLVSQYDKLDDFFNDAARASRELGDAQTQLNRIMRTGNTDTVQRQQVLERMNQAYSRSQAVQRNLMAVERQRQQQMVALAAASRQVAAEQDRIANAMSQTKLRMGDPTLTPEQLSQLSEHFDTLKGSMDGAEQQQKQLSFAMQEFRKLSAEVNAEMNKNQQTIDKAAAGRLKITQYYDAMAKSSDRMQRTAGILSRVLRLQSTSVLTGLRLMSAGFRGLQAVVTTTYAVLNRLVAVLRTVAGVLSGGFRSGMQTVTTVFNTLGRTAGVVGSGVLRAMNGMTAGVRTFATAVNHHMQAATRSMQQFYNAGWSLLTTGYMARGAGTRMFGGLSNIMEQFMDYEKILTRSAIAGATLDGGQMTSDPRGLEQQIFEIQRGVGPNREGAVKAFSAAEIASAMYYYSSAIGEAVTDVNRDVVTTILQMAAVTQTSVETATKGVLNIATEFGLDPRSDDKAMQTRIQNIAAQMGYLANISTMEVPDIAETFKMLGPMAYILSDRNEPGAGLEEMMALTFLASEVGLRGGNVGRGVGQALTTLLDPTEPAIAAAAEAFGFEASAEAFKAFFFNAKGQLKNGLPGLFEDIAALDPDKQAQALAAIFTQNATRATIGIAAASMGAALKERGGMAGLIKELQGQNPMLWLTEANEATNATLFASWQDLQSAWFATTTSIVRSIEGRLIPAITGIAEVFWRISDIITSNPWIGELLAGIIAVTGAVLTAVGTLFMFGGSLLLVMKAFSLLGGLFGPAIFFFTSMVSALLVIGPLLIGLAAAAVLVKKAWDSNFMGIQDRVDGLIESAREWAVWLSINGPDAARAFANVFEDRVLVQVERFQQLLAENDMYVNLAMRALTQFAEGVRAGFVGAITTVIAIIQRLGEAVNNVLDQFLPTRTNSVDEFIESFNRLADVSSTVAQALGVTLGAAVAGLILRQFVPAIVITGAFRAALIALGVASGTVSVAFTVLGGVISVVSTIVGVVTAAATGFGVLAMIIGGVLVGAVLSAVGVFVYLLATAEDIRANIMTIADAIWTGLRPALVVIAGLAVGGFQVLRVTIADTTATLAENRQGLERIATIVGYVLVGAFAALVVSILVVVSAIGTVITALNEAFSGDTGVGTFADRLRDDLESFATIFEFSEFPVNDISSIFRLRIKQVINALLKVLAQEFGEFINGSQMIAEDIVSKFPIIGEKLAQAFGLNETGGFMAGDAIADYWTEYLDNQIYQAEDQIEQIKHLADLRAEQARQAEASTAALSQSAHAIAFGYEGAAKPRQTPVDFLKDTFKAGTQGDFGEVLELFQDYVLGGKSIQEVAQSAMEMFNIDVGAFSDTEMFDFLDELTTMTTSTTDDLVVEYEKQKGAYQEWLNAVDAFGLQYATQMYQNMGKPIPTSPGTFDEWKDDQANQIEMTEEELLAKVKELNQNLYSALAGIDLGGALAGLNPGEFTLGQAAFMNADTIIQNAGSPEWLNNTELMADIAGMGFLSEGIGGVNAHQALTPALARLSEETGVAITDLLKDVPKYIVPQEFVPLATAELLKGLEMIGPTAYARIDDMGMDWAELVDYGIGQALAGHDWNLADYLASSMQISPEEAQRILQESVVNPFSITEDVFDDIQLMADMQGGQVSVLTEEWYAWLQEATQNGADRTLEVTRAAFEQLPDAVKIGFSQMGYTWVIGAEGAVADIERSSALMQEGMQRAYGAIYTDTGQWADEAVQKDFWSRIWDDLAANGVIDRQGMFVTEFEKNGEEWVRITDNYSGLTVEMPSVDFTAAAESARQAAEVAKQLDETRIEIEKTKELLREAKENDDFKPIYGPDATGWIATEQSVLEGKLEELRTMRDELLGITEEGTMQLPDIAPPANMKVLEESVTTAVETGFETAMTNLSTFTVPASFLTVFDTAFTTIGQNAGPKLVAGLTSGMSSGSGEAQTPSAVGATSGTGPFDAIFEGYAVSATLKFEAKVKELMPTTLANLSGGGEGGEGGEGGAAQATGPFDGIFKGYANTAMLAFETEMLNYFQTNIAPAYPDPGFTAGPFDSIFKTYATTAVTAFKTQVDTELAGWSPSAAGGVAAPTTAAGYGGAGTPTGGPFDAQFTDYGTSAVTAFETGIEPIGTVATTAGTTVYTNFSVALAPVIPNTEGMARGITNAFSNGLSGMDAATYAVVNSVIGILAGLGAQGYSTAFLAGQAIGMGLAAGMNSQLSAVQTAASMLAGATAAAAAARLQTASPSKVFMEIGSDIGEGLAMGIESRMGRNVDAMGSVISGLESATKPRGGNGLLSGSTTGVVRSGQLSTSMGDIHFHITKDVDIDRVFNRFNEMTGRKVEMARRGMLPADDVQIN